MLPAEVASLLPEPEAVASARDAHLDHLPRRDANLLRAVGIDLEEVRSAVRQTFGDSAVEDLGRRRVRQPWQPWRRPKRRCMSILAGSMSVAPRLKRSLERAGQDADRRKAPAIDPAALLLFVVEVEDAVANQILRDLGVQPERLARSLRSVSERVRHAHARRFGGIRALPSVSATTPNTWWTLSSPMSKLTADPAM